MIPTSSPRVILAVDVGGTQLKLGLIRGDQLIARDELPARPAEGLAPALARVEERVEALLQANALERSALAGVGLAFPGILAPHTPRVLSSPAGKFDDAIGFDFSRWARGWLDRPIVVSNDANAALAGEVRRGAARGCENVVMVTLGTGFGSAAMIEGRPLRGAHGQAGILGGHFSLDPWGRVCSCGNSGCVETTASTWVLPERLARQAGAAASKLSAEDAVGYAVVFREAAAGDPVAVALRDEALRVWSTAVVNLIHAYDPERVVIGGGIMRSAQVILPALQQHVARHAWTPWGQVKLVAAELGPEAGLWGAASLVEDSLAHASL